MGEITAPLRRAVVQRLGMRPSAPVDVVEATLWMSGDDEMLAERIDPVWTRYS